MDDIDQVLITPEEIQARVGELGVQISTDYAGRDPLLVGVLGGVFIFMADLVRAASIPLDVDFIDITHYDPAMRSHGAVRFTKDLTTSVRERHVLFVDLFDSGLSLRYLLRNLRAREPASLHACVMSDRPQTRVFDLEIAYTGFVLPDRVVVGYGLDYGGKHWNLPFLGTLREDAIARLRLP